MKKLIAAGLFLAFLSGCAGLPGVGGGNPGVHRLAALGVHPAEHMGPCIGVGNAIDKACVHIQVQGT